MKKEILNLLEGYDLEYIQYQGCHDLLADDILKLINKDEEKHKCKHIWKWGYTGEPVIFCTKCDIEIDQIYGMKIYQDKQLIDSIK